MTPKKPQHVPFSLSEKMARLEEIERAFQQPDGDLERAITLYEEVVTLGEEIKAYLDTAVQRVEEIEVRGLKWET